MYTVNLYMSGESNFNLKQGSQISNSARRKTQSGRGHSTLQYFSLQANYQKRATNCEHSSLRCRFTVAHCAAQRTTNLQPTRCKSSMRNIGTPAESAMPHKAADFGGGGADRWPVRCERTSHEAGSTQEALCIRAPSSNAFMHRIRRRMEKVGSLRIRNSASPSLSPHRVGRAQGETDYRRQLKSRCPRLPALLHPVSS